MSVILGLKPYNAVSPRTALNAGTKSALLEWNLAATALFLCACAATLTIWRADPLWDGIYECCILCLAGCLSLRITSISWQFALPLMLLAAWGFLQLAVGATVYPHATLSVALRFSAMAATALASYVALQHAPHRERFIEAFAWFGFLLSVTGVVAYYTSPGRVLWLFESPYPDVWGPFLSRNNFAQFLELALPAALWLAIRQPKNLLYWSMAASMLTAGLASASRAGAVLLLLEAIAMFCLCHRGRLRSIAAFGTTVLFLGALTGADTLFERFQSSNLLADRDHIYRSSLEMIAARPLQGYGLGTFEWVYPEFANFDPGYRIEHAHNDWLEWTTEGGLGFLAMWALFIIPAAWRSFRHPWALGIPAVFLHALADFPLARLGVAAWVFILLGALESAERRRRRETKIRPGARP